MMYNTNLTYTIKPLEWKESVFRGRWYAKTVLGVLMVGKTGGAWSWASFFDDEDAAIESPCESKKDGIAKAEACYIERIKQALEETCQP